jgi:hypothetical protein
VSTPERADVEVDFSRAKFGIRRYWWLVPLVAFLGALGAATQSASRTKVDSELRFSDQRERFEEDLELALTPIEVIPGIANAASFHDTVNERADATVSYSVSRSEGGFLVVQIDAEDETTALAHTEVVVGELNGQLGRESVETIERRLTELQTTIQTVESRIAEVRSQNNDEIAEILERSQLVGLLGQEQRSSAVLTGAAENPTATLIVIRQSVGSLGGVARPALGLVGGALVGLGIAALLGVLRKRVRDLQEFAQICGGIGVSRLQAGTPPDDVAAVALGLVRKVVPADRHATLLPVGPISQSAAVRLVDAGARIGLTLNINSDDSTTASVPIVLVSSDSQLADVVDVPGGANIVLVASTTDTIVQVEKQLERLRLAGFTVSSGLLVT